MSSLIPFNTGQLPGYLTTANAPTMASTFGGMESMNRIKLSNGRFRMFKGGAEVAMSAGPLRIVIEGFAPTLSRSYYATDFDGNAAEVGAPDCLSADGVTPLPASKIKQSTSCATCPHNVKSEAGLGKDCQTFKRLVVTLFDDLEVVPYVLDVKGMTIFGKDFSDQERFNLRGYSNFLAVRGVPESAAVTNLEVDTTANVSKMLFSALGILSADEYAKRREVLDADTVTRYTSVTLGASVRDATGVVSEGAGAHTPPTLPVLPAAVKANQTKTIDVTPNKVAPPAPADEPDMFVAAQAEALGESMESLDDLLANIGG